MHGDIGMGLLVALAVCAASGVEFALWYALAGVLAAIWPDIDSVPQLFKHKKVASHAQQTSDHRDGLHYPLVALPLVAAIVWATFGPTYAFIATIATFLHFVHDSFGIGWGIKWLWPLTDKNYKFFTDKENEYGKRHSRRRLLVAWDPSQLRFAIIRYGVADWMSIYLRSWLCATEFIVFLIGITLSGLALTT